MKIIKITSPTVFRLMLILMVSPGKNVQNNLDEKTPIMLIYSVVTNHYRFTNFYLSKHFQPNFARSGIFFFRLHYLNQQTFMTVIRLFLVHR